MIKEDAIYARQSIDKADSISIESQIEFCKYETRGNPYRIYQDKGYSGKNTERPEFQRMLAAIRNGEINRVICYKLDRCSRSILDFANLMEEFQKYGVEFVSCTEKFDTSSPMGRAMLNICIVFAQLERETIQQRVIDAYLARSKRGFFMGGKTPFGFTIEPYYLEGKKTARYVVNEKEAGITMKNYRALIQSILEKTDMSVALIPHVVWDRNNDRKTIEQLYEYFKDEKRVVKIEDHSCEELKGYISRCRFFIGARTHATIAAYSSLVPTLVVGYSVKAKGIAKDLFGTYERYVEPVQNLETEEQLLAAFQWLYGEEEKIRKRLTEVMPEYVKRAQAAGDKLQELMAK